MARKLNREMFLLLGGTAALLMQIAHPLVAAGVAAHSDFRRRPLTRLRRTLDTTLAVVFAEPDDARAALRRIDRRHVSIRGRSASGRPYDARDPELLLWVQATLVLTSLRLYELVRGRLAPAERERYWQEAKPIATALGIPAARLPTTLADLESYEREALAHEVRPDAASRALARSILRPMRWLPGALLWPVDAFTAGLLTPALREAFGLPWRTRERLAFRAAVAALRLVRPLVPDRLAIVPQARRFEAARAPRQADLAR
jgi:uncharacterized protein (DUF2236 family)